VELTEVTHRVLKESGGMGVANKGFADAISH